MKSFPKHLIPVLIFALSPNPLTCQEIISKISEFTEKPNNIFQSENNPSPGNGTKVSDLGDYIIIDYTKKHYLHSFIFDKEMEFLEQLGKKLGTESYPNFVESYGNMENRIFVFQGSNDGKLYFVEISNKREGTLIELEHEHTIGSFVHQNTFYNLGFDPEKKIILLSKVDKELKKEEIILSLDQLCKNLEPQEKESIEKIFFKKRFSEVSEVQLNSTAEIIQKNKLYIENGTLIMSLNPEVKGQEIFKTYLASIDLSDFSSCLLKYQINPPVSILSKKTQLNSFYTKGRLFALIGNSNGFLISIFNIKTGEQLYNKSFDEDSFLDFDTSLLFDFEPDRLFPNKKNVQKSIAKRLKDIFALRAGLKASIEDEHYLITVGGVGFGGGMQFVNMPGASNSIQSSNMVFMGPSFSINKSMILKLNKVSWKLEESIEYPASRDIWKFRQENFFKRKDASGQKQKVPNKTFPPRAEVQFKLGNSYFLAYYSNRERQYIIRKFD